MATYRASSSEFSNYFVGLVLLAKPPGELPRPIRKHRLSGVTKGPSGP
jgi:hypothetical protein